LPVVLLGILAQATGVAAPYVARKLIDGVYANQDASMIDTLIAVSIVLVICTVFWQNAQAFCSQVLRIRLQRGLANRLYEQVLGQPAEFFRLHGPGEISSRFQTLRSSLGTLVSGLQNISGNVGFLIIIPPLLFFIQVKLAVIAISIIPPTVYLTYKQCAAAQGRVRDYVEQTAENDEFQTSTFVGIRSLKGLNAGEYCRAAFQARNAQSDSLQRRHHRTNLRYNVSMSALRALSLSLCTLLGWHLVLTKAITVGQFIAFMAYVNYLYSPLRVVIEALATMQDAVVSLETPLEFMFRPLETHTWRTSPASPAVIGNFPDGMSLDNVRFGYAGAPALFNQLNAAFDRGTTAIVGQSGSGKTTLLQLLCGLYAPLAGAVRYGGIDIRHVPLENVRSQIAVVWQDSWVVPGSMWENLVMNRVIARREVEHMIEVCQMTELMSSLPHGYKTRLGSGGVMLSAGQRQLLSLARALLRKTPVLLLDEATANIDLAIEERLLQALLNERCNQVTVITTHRSASAMLADRVLVCRRGLLEEVTMKLRAPLSFSRNGSAANATDDRIRALLNECADVVDGHGQGRNVEVR
jgi:ABC-type bacteriocin/lantibiotic exporter with double-glycine peptidase domain